MSSSLKDQLLQAGFKAKQEKKPTKPPAKRTHPTKNNSANNLNAVNKKKAEALNEAKLAAERKAQKAQIKTLIEEHAITDYAGDIAYRFILQKRIRELHVSESIRKQLVADDLIITRLNGKTLIVPKPISDEIIKINPNWAIVRSNQTQSENNDGYDEFQVPDDLIW